MAMKRWMVLLAVFGVIAAACTAGTEDQGAPAPIETGADVSHAPATVSIWVPFAGAEYKKMSVVFDMFEQEYPWITVDVRTGIGENDEKVLAAIRAGNPPDAVMSWSLDSVGKFCSSDAWQDLTPYIEQSSLDTSIFPDSVTRYTSYGGSQCALPFLTDAMGLYYNKDLLAKHGYTEPPKTMSELTEMAKELTEFNPDGSIKVAGFIPVVRLLRVHTAGAVDHLRGELLQRGRHRVRRRDRPRLAGPVPSGRRTWSTSTARTTSRSSSRAPETSGRHPTTSTAVASP